MEYKSLKLQKFASLAVAGVPTHQICAVLQISDEEFNELQASEEYKLIYESLLENELEREEQFKTLNSAWDTLEANALSRLYDLVSWNGDPEFILRIAAVANKSIRKSVTHARPIDGAVAANATITLNQNFIQKLTHNYTINNGDDKDGNSKVLEHKKTDYMDAGRVEELLEGEKNKLGIEELDEIFDIELSELDALPAE